MTRKRQTLKILADYFIEVGRILSKKEYMARRDTPMRAAIVGRQFTSWARLEKLIAKNFPEKYAVINAPEVEEESVVIEVDKEELDA